MKIVARQCPCVVHRADGHHRGSRIITSTEWPLSSSRSFSPGTAGKWPVMYCPRLTRRRTVRRPSQSMASGTGGRSGGGEVPHRSMHAGEHHPRQAADDPGQEVSSRLSGKLFAQTLSGRRKRRRPAPQRDTPESRPSASANRDARSVSGARLGHTLGSPPGCGLVVRALLPPPIRVSALQSRHVNAHPPRDGGRPNPLIPTGP